MAEVKTRVFLEYGGKQYDFDKLADQAKKDYKKSNKTELKDIEIYVKPEDGKAYYTANSDKVHGDIDL